MRRRSTLPGVLFALCVLPWAAACVQAQEPFLDIPLVELPKGTPAVVVEEPSVLTQTQITPQRPQSIPVSPNTGLPKLEKAQDLTKPANAGYFPLVELAMQSSEYMDPRYVVNSQHSNEPTRWEQMRDAYKEQTVRLFCSDFRNMYWSENTLWMVMAVAAAAPIANTHADQGFRDWYQRQCGNSSGATDVALGLKHLGQHMYTVPVCVAISLTGHLQPEHEAGSVFAQFGDRSLRALTVGAPMVGIMQVGLGGQRPEKNDSHWQPFETSYGVSGHAFVGAIPFLTAASMTKNRPLQTLFFVGSFATGWSRIHNDDHYLSQVLLGWTVAFLSVHAVNQTEDEEARRVQFVPMVAPNCVGLGVAVDY